MENPKCPYCGEEMKFSYGYDGNMNGHYWYRCDNCNALAPEANSPEEAYAAAMKREKKCKTYAEDFREHFNREWNDGTSTDIPFFLCRNQLYKGQYCDMHSSKAVNYKACAECWNEVMEDEDE